MFEVNARRYEVALALASVWSGAGARNAVWQELGRSAVQQPRVLQGRIHFFGAAGLRREPSDPVALVQEGYADGVPMGQALPAGTGPPTFTACASLLPCRPARYEIWFAKAWVDRLGKACEQLVHPPRGARVWHEPGPFARQRGLGGPGRVLQADVRSGPGRSWRSVWRGEPETHRSIAVMGAWTDVDFDASVPALFYAMVLEVEPGLPEGGHGAFPRTTLDAPGSRVHTPVSSKPIWYAPCGRFGPSRPSG